MLLTVREEEIMQMFWEHGPMLVREMVQQYPDPKPHNNSVSTIVRILEQKGHVSHEDIGGGIYRYFAVTEKSNIRRKRLGDVIRNFFSSCYMSVVSELVKEEKISVDELRDLIDMVERGSEKK